MSMTDTQLITLNTKLDVLAEVVRRIEKHSEIVPVHAERLFQHRTELNDHNSKIAVLERTADQAIGAAKAAKGLSAVTAVLSGVISTLIAYFVKSK